MEEIHKLRQQIAHIVTATFPETEKELNEMMKPPSEKQARISCPLLTSETYNSYTDQTTSANRHLRVHRPNSRTQRLHRKAHWGEAIVGARRSIPGHRS